MAFEKPQATSYQERTKFDLNNEQDLFIIKGFEKEIEECFKNPITLFGKVLSGYELYLHKRELVRYSSKYPQGAVVFDNLDLYHLAEMKYRALKELWDREKKARKYDDERVQSLIPSESIA